jgi:hypothetical protein
MKQDADYRYALMHAVQTAMEKFPARDDLGYEDRMKLSGERLGYFVVCLSGTLQPGDSITSAALMAMFESQFGKEMRE